LIERIDVIIGLHYIKTIVVFF